MVVIWETNQKCVWELKKRVWNFMTVSKRKRVSLSRTSVFVFLVTLGCLYVVATPISAQEHSSCNPCGPNCIEKCGDVLKGETTEIKDLGWDKIYDWEECCYTTECIKDGGDNCIKYVLWGYYQQKCVTKTYCRVCQCACPCSYTGQMEQVGDELQKYCWDSTNCECKFLICTVVLPYGEYPTSWPAQCS